MAADFKELAELYKALAPAERAALAPEGRLGTLAGRLGGRAFGPKPREEARMVERVVKRRRVEALEDGYVPVAQSDTLDLVAFSSELVACKSNSREIDAAHREQNHATAVAVEKWRESDGVKARDALLCCQDVVFTLQATALGVLGPSGLHRRPSDVVADRHCRRGHGPGHWAGELCHCAGLFVERRPGGQWASCDLALARWRCWFAAPRAGILGLGVLFWRRGRMG